jgi:hypothetical protein
MNAPIRSAKFPQGGLTPVFNEITAVLTIAPHRPDPDTKFEDLTGPKERIVMKNVIDEAGIVQPTVFVRSNTFSDPNTGLNTQVLSLAACSGVAESKLLGGEVAVHVRGISDVPGMMPADLPPGALRVLDRPLIGGRAATPREPSIGKIQAISATRDFPARVTIPVYYSLILGKRKGALANVSENASIEAQDPHFMEAIVESVPPDPQTCLRGREWDLVTSVGEFLKVWVKIECFRFLGLADWEQTKRVVFEESPSPARPTSTKSRSKSK